MKFDTKNLLKSDLLARYQAWQIATGGKPFVAVEEVRDFEGLPKMPESPDGVDSELTDLAPTAPAGNAPTEGPPA